MSNKHSQDDRCFLLFPRQTEEKDRSGLYGIDDWDDGYRPSPTPPMAFVDDVVLEQPRSLIHRVVNPDSSPSKMVLPSLLWDSWCPLFKKTLAFPTAEPEQGRGNDQIGARY